MKSTESTAELTAGLRLVAEAPTRSAGDGTCWGWPIFMSAMCCPCTPACWPGIKVACVVTGDIVAVIAAHDKALRLLPAGHQLTGQLTMMLVMVGYTFTGLYLLFGG